MRDGEFVCLKGIWYHETTIIKDYILLYADDPQRIMDYSKNGYVLYGNPFNQNDRSFQAMILYGQFLKELDKNLDVTPGWHNPQSEFNFK